MGSYQSKFLTCVLTNISFNISWSVFAWSGNLNNEIFHQTINPFLEFLLTFWS